MRRHKTKMHLLDNGHVVTTSKQLHSLGQGQRSHNKMDTRSVYRSTKIYHTLYFFCSYEKSEVLKEVTSSKK